MLLQYIHKIISHSDNNYIYIEKHLKYEKGLQEVLFIISRQLFPTLKVRHIGADEIANFHNFPVIWKLVCKSMKMSIFHHLNTTHTEIYFS